MATDWNAFTAFQGAALLDRTFMGQALVVGTQDVNWPTETAKFTTFIAALRAGPAACGIPDEYVDAVRSLLDEFFPAGNPIVRCRTIPNPGIGLNRIADPINVPWGTVGGQQLSIADAPSALGYIFSVVSPTANQTWQAYYLPLLAMFSKCLWLAFIEFLPAAPAIPNTLGVPVMSNAMWQPPTAATPNYLFGSTWMASAPAVAPLNAALIDDQKRAMDQFRRTGVLAVELNTLHPGAQLPRWDPKTTVQYSVELLRAFRQTSDPPRPPPGGVPGPRPVAVLNNAAATLLRNAYVVQIKAYYAAITPQTPETGAVALSQLLAFPDHVLVRPALQALAANLLDLRFTPGVLPVNIANAYIALIAYVITPQLYTIATPTLPSTAVALPPGMAATIQAEATVIWTAKTAEGLAKLEWIYRELTLPIISARWLPTNWWGRCAETYPVVGVQPNYVAGTNSALTEGIALENKKLGVGCDAFNAAFNNTQLGLVGQAPGGVPPAKSVFRLPCINCQALLPQLNLNLAVYDGPIATAAPAAFPAW